MHGQERDGDVHSRTVLSSGVIVCADRLSSSGLTELPFALEQSPLMLGYQVAGTTFSEFRGAGPLSAVSYAPGGNAIGYYPHASGRMECRGREYCAVTLLVPPEVLGRYCVGEGCCLPRALRGVLEGRTEQGFVHHGQETPVKQMLLHRILGHSSCHAFSPMALEAVCLELIALQLGEYIGELGGANRNTPALSASDEERIRAARDMLVRDLENPPSLVELARLAGINDFKLKRGFRAVFGTTVFGYFRDYRLDRARELLDRGDMNVSEAAFHIGYSNLGHFSKAFHQRFGIRPKEYLRRHSRR